MSTLQSQWRRRRALQACAWFAASALVVWAWWWSQFDLAALAGSGPRLLDFFTRLTPPDWSALELILRSTFETLMIALAGTALAILIALPLGFMAASNVSPPWLSFFSFRVAAWADLQQLIDNQVQCKDPGSGSSLTVPFALDRLALDLRPGRASPGAWARAPWFPPGSHRGDPWYSGRRGNPPAGCASRAVAAKGATDRRAGNLFWWRPPERTHDKGK